MQKVKFFSSSSVPGLEKMVNEFITDKKIISISYGVMAQALYVLHTCCILYED